MQRRYTRRRPPSKRNDYFEPERRIAAAHRRRNLGTPPQRGEHERLPEHIDEIMVGLEPIRQADPGADVKAMAARIRRENRLANRGQRPLPRHKHRTTNLKKIRFAIRREVEAIAAAKARHR